MQVICTVIFASLLSVQSLIMPVVKPDGSLDISSLVGHILLLERTVEKVQAELQTSLTEQKVTQSKLDTALNDLKDLSNVKTELAILQSQIHSGIIQPIQPVVTRLETDVSTLKTEISQLQSLHNQTATAQGSSVYTRWGKTSCPTGNNTVYKGYAAGSYYEDKGGSASTLCLPEHPVYSYNTSTAHEDSAALIMGVEYNQAHSTMPFQSLDQEDMPCVVCESKRATSIMVPARNACYQGWTLEYSGILMGGYKTFSTADYICVDTDAEAIPGGRRTKNSRFLYPIMSKCDSLLCPPFAEGKIITCVVCSK